MRRPLAALTATALAATMATTLGGASTSAGATTAVDEAPFTLWARDRVVAYDYRGNGKVRPDLGLRIVGGAHDFEVRSHRADWDQEIVTNWTAGESGGTLPEGTQNNFRKLRRMLRVDYRTLDGDLAYRRRVSPCLNGWESERVRPEAAPRNEYPFFCPWNPYTVGSVQGVQAGWATAIRTGRAVLEQGRYDVTVSVTPKWAEALGLSGDEGEVTLRLVVKRPTDDGHDHHHRARPTERPEAAVARPAAREPVSPSAGTTAGPRPDLRSLPAFGIGLNRKGTVLRFSANVWNAGDSPLVVDGFRRDDEEVMDAYQYFFDAEGNQVGYELVGEMKYHRANHQHWHFQDFARYRLLHEDKSEAARSRKVSFCLANTDAVDYTVPGADWRPDNTDLSTSCGYEGSLSVREVLSSGSGDTYAQFRAGQAFRITDLPNGWYWIAVEANPRGNLIEHDETNNVSYRRVKLAGTPENRRVKVPQVGIIDESSGGRWYW